MIHSKTGNWHSLDGIGIPNPSSFYPLWCWYWAGSHGAPGLGSLSASSTSWLQETDFTASMVFSWVLMGRFQFLLIREGRGCRDKAGAAKLTIVQPWGRVLAPPQGINFTISLSCLQWLKPPPSGKVWGCAAHIHVDSRPVGTRRLMMLIPDYLTTNQAENCPPVDHAIFDPLL